MARAHETPALSTLMRTRTIGSVEAGAEDVEGAPAAGKRPLTPADEEPPFPSSVSSFSLVRSRSSCACSSCRLISCSSLLQLLHPFFPSLHGSVQSSALEEELEQEGAATWS